MEAPFSRGRDVYNLAVLGLFLVILLLFGGASRVDVLGQAVVRIVAILVLISSLFQFDHAVWRRSAVPAVLYVALALVVGWQLIPLPPDMWASLPGRSIYVEALSRANVLEVWRPVSLVPDRTLNAFLAVLPPAAAVAVIALLPAAAYRWVLMAILGAIGVSAVLGVFQIAAGGPYFYSITNFGSAVGSFANRNHAALFTAVSLPLLAAWAVSSDQPRGRRSGGLRLWLALCATLAVFPMLLVTGSRGGLMLGVLGAFGAAAIYFGIERSRLRKRRLLILGGAAAIAALVSAVFVIFSRDEALRRALGPSQDQLRSELLPVYLRMVADHFPFGSGFGSFEAIYKIYETREALGPFYLNQAHNDLLQLIIEGGLPALLLLIAWISWLGYRSWLVWRHRNAVDAALPRAASVVVALIGIHSLFDYPLRTPLIAVLFAAMCMFLTNIHEMSERRPAQGRQPLGKQGQSR